MRAIPGDLPAKLRIFDTVTFGAHVFRANAAATQFRFRPPPGGRVLLLNGQRERFDFEGWEQTVSGGVCLQAGLVPTATA
jgi:hypothetical protein